MEALKRFARVLLGSLMLLGMPAWNGMPTMFADTKAYMTLGEAAWSKALGVASAPQQTSEQAPAASSAGEKTRRALAGAAARSPYFSAYLYALAAFGTFWLVVAVQALLTSATVDIFLRALGIVGSKTHLLTMAALASLSTSPIFVGFMMPDIFAGLGSIAAATLVIRGKSTSTWEVIFLAAIVGFSSLVHSTHVLLIASAAFGAFAASLVTRADALRRLSVRSATVIALGLLGPLGAIVYGAAAKAVLNEEIHRPPFLTARLLEDGPGRSFLKKACAEDENAFELCRYRDRALTDSQVFLWDRATPEGVFAAADPDTRIRLSREEGRFVAGALASAPGEQALASLDNFLGLVTRFRVDDVTDTSAVFRDAEFRTLSSFAPNAARCVETPDSCMPGIPVMTIGYITGVASAIALLMVVLLLAVPTWRDQVLRERGFIIASALFTAVLSNAIVCAAFSGPFARYQTRMSWLIVLAACVVLALWRKGQRGSPGQPSR